MLAIKLSRFGKRKQPTYRLLVLEKSKDPWGNYLENLGHYNPRSKEAVFNADRIKYWISKGAQPTDSVHNLLITKGVIEGKKIGVTKITKKRAAKLEKENADKAAALKAKKEKEEADKAAKQAAAEAQKAAEAAKKSEPAEEPKTETPPETEKKAE
ncbi:MAG: 30S ribosomal protein S16 [Patescibacteria group bacterium]